MYAYVRVGGVCMCMCVYREVGARVGEVGLHVQSYT